VYHGSPGGNIKHTCPLRSFRGSCNTLLPQTLPVAISTRCGNREHAVIDPVGLIPLGSLRFLLHAASNVAANVRRRRLPVLKGGFCVSTVSGRGRWLSSRVASTASGDGSAEDDHRRLVWLMPDLPSPVSCEHISSTGCHRSEPGDGTVMIERICKPNLAKNYFVANGCMRIRAGSMTVKCPAKSVLSTIRAAGVVPTSATGGIGNGAIQCQKTPAGRHA
jgi:hypothetical protein